MFSKAQMSVIEANMAIHQSKKQSDLEKRLKILRQQFYGRESVTSNQQTQTTNYHLPTSDVTYLHKDLLKILTFASVALGAQFILFFLMRNHILNLKFF